MKVISISVPGSVITKKSAAGYLERVARYLFGKTEPEAMYVLGDIETRIVDAGFLTWPEIEEIEIKAIGPATPASI